MKALILVLGLLCLSASHDVAIAVFEIQEVENGLRLKAVFDLSDLCSELDADPSNLTPKLLQRYINDHTRFVFDSNLNTLLITDIAFRKDHLEVMGQFEKNPSLIKSIAIENHCLLSVDNHSNIVQVKLNGWKETFACIAIGLSLNLSIKCAQIRNKGIKSDGLSHPQQQSLKVFFTIQFHFLS